MLKNTLFREKNGSRKPENGIQKKSCFRKPFKIPPPPKKIKHFYDGLDFENPARTLDTSSFFLEQERDQPCKKPA